MFPQPYEHDYLAKCELEAIQDPAESWNAVTVGAFTDLVQQPNDPSFAGWTPLGKQGDISPHSRTSVIAGDPQWPIKPDICMEGGNVLTDGAKDFHESHPLLSLATTHRRSDTALGTANMTSAATSQASRLAAIAMARYPSYWPETIRGLLVHEAEWTPEMVSQIVGEPTKDKRLLLLRRYGWGVPSEASVLTSSRNAVTMVTQDEFVPFEGNDLSMRQFRLHRLPWPKDVLKGLAFEDVELRVTISYFIEPNGARRGWRRRYSYASHGLRFELITPMESVPEFVRRVNRVASDEEEGVDRPSSGSERWLIGPQQRNKG